MIDINALVLAGLIYLKDKEEEKNKMKVFDKKDVFSWANAEDAKEYIGKEGYFAHTLSQLNERIQKSDFERLEKIDDSNTNCFCKESDGAMCYWSMFLPADKVKEVEEPKKYRPFKNLNEFKQCISKDTLTCLDHGIEIIDMSNNSQYRLMILGTFTNGIIFPLYGALTFERLFKRFKININGSWQPFGMLENEN